MKLTQQERILKVLRAVNSGQHNVPPEYLKDGWLSARYLKQVMLISEANGRISELRGEGHDISTLGEDEHGFAYHKLLDSPVSPNPAPQAYRYEPVLDAKGRAIAMKAIPL